MDFQFLLLTMREECLLFDTFRSSLAELGILVLVASSDFR